MQKLRSLHLYLGCVFAPMLLFFAVSGIWQMFGLNNRSGLLAALSTLHTEHGLKRGTSLSSPFTLLFVLLMAIAFIVTTILGIMMALKFGKSRRAAVYCLAAGIAIPIALVLIGLVARI